MGSIANYLNHWLSASDRSTSALILGGYFSHIKQWIALTKIFVEFFTFQGVYGQIQEMFAE